MSADMYLTLDAYLEVVVPQIGRVQWAPRVELAAGVNAMDLTGLATEMMHLVIKSTIDWIAEHAEGTLIVIPEAWRFIPQGRGTPVKLSASAFIRQGAALKNFLWLDSQDLGNIEKEILRSVPVWLLGVQRETNEIKRTLDNIPASIKKPSKADIATLELGQFYACWGKHAIKTYVQPAWMNPAQAEQVATGALTVDVASRLSPGRPKESIVNEQEARALREENAQLKRDNDDLRRRLEALEKGSDETKATVRNGRQVGAQSEDSSRQLSAQRTRDHGATERGDRTPSPVGQVDRNVSSTASMGDQEALYQAIKARLLAELPEEPTLIRLLVSRPELQVHIEPKVLTVDDDSTLGRVGRLVADGFFDDTKRFREILRELERTGTRINNKSLSVALKELVVGRFLTKENVDSYRAAGAKVSTVNRKTS